MLILILENSKVKPLASATVVWVSPEHEAIALMFGVTGDTFRTIIIRGNEKFTNFHGKTVGIVQAMSEDVGNSFSNPDWTDKNVLLQAIGDKGELTTSNLGRAIVNWHPICIPLAVVLCGDMDGVSLKEMLRRLGF